MDLGTNLSESLLRSPQFKHPGHSPQLPQLLNSSIVKPGRLSRCLVAHLALQFPPFSPVSLSVGKAGHRTE